MKFREEASATLTPSLGTEVKVAGGWANGRVMAVQVGPKARVISGAASPRGQVAYVSGD